MRRDLLRHESILAELADNDVVVRVVVKDVIHNSWQARCSVPSATVHDLIYKDHKQMASYEKNIWDRETTTRTCSYRGRRSKPSTELGSSDC
jgi:hypothetical protein